LSIWRTCSRRSPTGSWCTCGPSTFSL
jgi:hypothetical protein